MPITDLLERNHKLYGDEVALVELNPLIKDARRKTWKEYDLVQQTSATPYRREITWSVFDEKANRVANMLLSRGVKKGGGSILGVIPKFFENESIEAIYDECDELLTPDTMRERKQLMEDNADAFIVVPGGIGTFEEFFEILTLKQLCRHNKPIAIYNLKGYYDDINHAMEQAMKKNFIRDNCKELYFTTDNLSELFAYIENPAEEIRTVKELKDG